MAKPHCNCAFVAWGLWIRRGGSCLVRPTREPLAGMGLHWIWSPVDAPDLGFWRTFRLFRRLGGYWWLSWTPWRWERPRFFWTPRPPRRAIHYEPRVRMDTTRKALLHKLWFAGRLRHCDSEWVKDENVPRD